MTGAPSDRAALDALCARIRASVRKNPDGAIDVARERRAMERFGALPPVAEGTRVEQSKLAGLSCDVIAPENLGANAPRILYFHGGAFALGSPETHRAMLSHLAKACAARVWCVDYRRAPEHPFPAAIDDALAAWKELAQDGPAFVMGDSCGGNLSVVTMQRAKAEGAPLARGMVLLSPWVDLTLGGESIKTNAERDPLIREGDSRAYAALYLNGRSPRDPLASPLFGDSSGLPPTYVQAARGEILLDDARRFAEKMRAKLDVFDLDLHVWQLLAGLVPEADEAIARIGTFVRTTP